MESKSDPGDRPRSDPAEPKVAASLDSQGNGQTWRCLPAVPLGLPRVMRGIQPALTIAHRLPSRHHEWISHKTQWVPPCPNIERPLHSNMGRGALGSYLSYILP